MQFRIVSILLLVVISGCVTPTKPIDPGSSGQFADFSSGYVGCDPSEIQVSDVRAAQGRSTWVATCKGRPFYCSSLSILTSGGAAISMSCAEALR